METTKSIYFSKEEFGSKEYKKYSSSNDYCRTDDYQECECIKKRKKCDKCDENYGVLKGREFTRIDMKLVIDNLIDKMINRYNNITIIQDKKTGEYKHSKGDTITFNAELDEDAFNDHYIVNNKKSYLEFIEENYDDEVLAQELKDINEKGYVTIASSKDKKMAEELICDGTIESRFCGIDDVEEGLFHDYNEFEFLKYLINKGHFGKIKKIEVEHGYDSQDHCFNVISYNKIPNNFDYDKNAVDKILSGEIEIVI